MISDFPIYRIIVILISLYFLVSGFYKFFKREHYQSLFKLLVTLIVWGGILIFISTPNITHFISKKLGLGENLNTLIFTGFILVFILLFKLINIIEKVERDITDIVRKEAIKKIGAKSNE